MIATDAPADTSAPKEQNGQVTQPPLDLSDYMPTEQTNCYLMELSSSHIKTPDGYSAIGFLREHPLWLDRARIASSGLELNVSNQIYRVECASKVIPQAIFLPQR